MSKNTSAKSGSRFVLVDMKRVSRRACDDGPVLEDQETEGQRQLHCLLLQQLHTDVDIDRCVAKKKCFAPATLYKPFGEQAAGVRSLAQFQALQDGDQELAALRELGLTDGEIELWRNRDGSGNGAEGRGARLAPDVREDWLQAIQDKMAARAELLARPQRFSASRALSRREMEIEKALFHGNDRCSFLTALYHQEANSQNGQQEAVSSNPVDEFYRDLLREKQKDSDTSVVSPEPIPSNKPDLSQADSSHNHSTLKSTEPDQSRTVEDSTTTSSSSHELQPGNRQMHSLNQEKRSVFSQKIAVNQPIGNVTALCGHGQGSPVTVTGRIEEISDGEITNNRETEEGIRKISRFQNYQRGEPSNVLCVKNMSLRASLAQLVALFSRFQKGVERPILYRLLTGRLKGQAFITFSDIETAQTALEMLNGYRLMDKPLVIEFGRERKDPPSGNCFEDSSTASVQRTTEACKD